MVMGFCFSAVILLAMYKEITLDYINESVMYLPLFAMLLTTMVNLEIYEYRIEEIYYVANVKKLKTFIFNVSKIILIEATVIVFNYLMYGVLFDIGFEHSIEKRLYFEAVFIAMLYITSITTFMCVLLKRKSSVLCVISLIWIYWMVNATQVSSSNPFIFVAIPSEYESFIIGQILISLLLLLGAFLLESKGPFWIKDTISRVGNKIYRRI